MTRQLMLHDLPNISKVIKSRLLKAGINTPSQLLAIGSQEAFLRLKLQDPSCCVNMLYALEGAIEGIRWHHLSDEKKRELKAFYKSF
ncbi:TfoX/Sxy family protein [Paenibacillus puldeungensis]|uniref:TfoX/Sxy family protein n=1 Tax=Paenibacillus puldeungensis TaxID=696536 RepID=A0ABW3RR78_9BACL